MGFEFADEYPIHRPLITSQRDVVGDVFDSINDEEEDIAYQCRLKDINRGSFFESLAVQQFEEGARNYVQNPAYANRCNQRFQLLTDVSKFLKGGR